MDTIYNKTIRTRLFHFSHMVPGAKFLLISTFGDCDLHFKDEQRVTIIHVCGKTLWTRFRKNNLKLGFSKFIMIGFLNVKSHSPISTFANCGLPLKVTGGHYV